MSLVSWNGWCRWYKWYIFQSWWNIVWCRFGELWYLSMYREKLLRNLRWSRRSCRNHIWSSPSALVLRSDHMDLRNLKVIGCHRSSWPQESSAEFTCISEYILHALNHGIGLMLRCLDASFSRIQCILDMSRNSWSWWILSLLLVPKGLELHLWSDLHVQRWQRSKENPQPSEKCTT